MLDTQTSDPADPQLPPPDSGEPLAHVDTEVFQELQQLLAQAGATVPVDTLASWTAEECDEASAWARAQIEAHASDDPGHHTSVQWPDHVSAAHHEAHAPAPIDEPAPAPVDMSGVTEARCPQCTSKATWKGPITIDMLARTFTRGLSETTGLPNCPACGTAMERITVAPIADAMTMAAEELPGRTEARQPSIPGLRPPFDFESAFLSIMERSREVRRLNAIAERKSTDAKNARKAAESEQSELTALETEYDDRAQDAISEAAKPPEERRRICAAEQKSGQPCPICRPKKDVTVTPDAQLAHDIIEAIDLMGDKGKFGPDDLRKLIAKATEIQLTTADVQRWTVDQAKTVLLYLQARLVAKMDGLDPNGVTKPAILGRYHIVGLEANTCADCGEVLEAPEGGVWAAGSAVGLNCPGKAAAAPAAPQGEPARRAKPRHATNEGRQKAKQASAREERESEPKAKPAGKKAAKGRRQ